MRKYVIGSVVLLVCLLASLTGCSGTGFDKHATLVPDSVTLSYGQSRYREEDSAYMGGTISATWNFK